MWYSPSLFVCFHKENEGRRVFEDSTACNKIENEEDYDKETSDIS